MNRFPFALLPVALLAAGPSAGQTPSRPSLILTIFAGVSTGPSLWSVGSQPFCSESVCDASSPSDTFSLSRDIASGVIAGLGATYFVSPHVGFQGEIYYAGLAFDDRCRDLSASPVARNAEICARVNSSNLSTSAISFVGSLVLRAAPHGAFSPYVRAGPGLATYSAGTVETLGSFTGTGGTLESAPIYLDPKPKRIGVSIQVAAGFTSRFGSGYQFRLEVRDAYAPLERVTGPADINTQIPSKRSSYFHRVALTAGLDVILEKGRGRRY